MAFALLLALMLPVIWGGAPAAQIDLQREPLVLETAGGAYTFQVEIADTREEKSQGLMFRRSLGKREGMLFVYEESQAVTMWMRNTFIPLDMVFILADGHVHRIEAMTEPHSERIVSAGERVTGVLEIAGGVAAKIGLQPGDLVRHRHFETSIK